MTLLSTSQLELSCSRIFKLQIMISAAFYESASQPRSVYYYFLRYCPIDPHRRYPVALQLVNCRNELEIAMKLKKINEMSLVGTKELLATIIRKLKLGRTTFQSLWRTKQFGRLLASQMLIKIRSEQFFIVRSYLSPHNDSLVKLMNKKDASSSHDHNQIWTTPQRLLRRN